MHPWREEIRSQLRLAAPIVLVQLGLMAMGAVDVAFMGRVSAVDYAAVSLGRIWTFTCIVFGMGLLTALDPIISQAWGAKDELAIRRVEGATTRDVALQVTVEGVMLALVGGLAGLPIGYVGADVLRDIVDFPFRFELRYAAVATGVAILLGLFASVLPARHAARLQPVAVLTRRRT